MRFQEDSWCTWYLIYKIFVMGTKKPNHLGWSEHSYLVGYCNFKIKWLAGWCHINIETRLWRIHTSMLVCGSYELGPPRVETSLCHDMKLAERSNKLMQAVLIDALNNQETVLANLELLFWSSLFEAFIEFVLLEGRMDTFAFHFVVLDCLFYWYAVFWWV